MAPSEQLVDPTTGIITGLRVIPLDPGSPAIYCAATQISDTTRILGAKSHGMNGGAGISGDVAVQAAIGESVERYCAASSSLHEVRGGTAQQLLDSGDDPILPAEIALFDEEADHGPFAPFTPTTPVGWVTCRSLLTQQERAFPACLVFIPYHKADDSEQIIGPAISTGLACYSTFEGAVLRGVYEAVERDAFAIAWLNRIRLPRLDVDDPDLKATLQDRFYRPGLEYSLHLAALDLGVPAVFSIITDHNFDPPLMCVGGAARLNGTDAALKALVESVQGWVWARQERLDDPDAGDQLILDGGFDFVTNFDTRVKLYGSGRLNHAFDFLRDASTVPLSALADPRRTDPAALDEVLRRVGQAGLDVLAVDLTTSDVRSCGFHVVKVVIPRLEQLEGDHRLRLLGGTRWREVPERLGLPRGASWAANPFPHPYP